MYKWKLQIGGLFLLGSNYFKLLVVFAAACNCNKPVRFAAVKWTAIVNPHLLVSGNLNVLHPEMKLRNSPE